MDQPQRFRTALTLADVTGEVAYLVRNSFQKSTTSVGQYYGFKASSATLYGVATSSGFANESLINLGTIDSAVLYDLEAVFIPDGKITFNIRSTATDLFEERGILTTGLPNATLTTAFFEAYLTNKDGTGNSKRLFFSYVEYIQAKK